MLNNAADLRAFLDAGDNSDPSSTGLAAPASSPIWPIDYAKELARWLQVAESARARDPLAFDQPVYGLQLTRASAADLPALTTSDIANAAAARPWVLVPLAHAQVRPPRYVVPLAEALNPSSNSGDPNNPSSDAPLTQRVAQASDRSNNANDHPLRLTIHPWRDDDADRAAGGGQDSPAPADATNTSSANDPASAAAPVAAASPPTSSLNPIAQNAPAPSGAGDSAAPDHPLPDPSLQSTWNQFSQQFGQHLTDALHAAPAGYGPLGEALENTRAARFGPASPGHHWEPGLLQLLYETPAFQAALNSDLGQYAWPELLQLPAYKMAHEGRWGELRDYLGSLARQGFSDVANGIGNTIAGLAALPSDPDFSAASWDPEAQQRAAEKSFNAALVVGAPALGRAALGEGGAEFGAFGGRGGRPKAPVKIGSFEPPPGVNFGTTTFGNYAHERAADILQDLHPKGSFVFRVKPGMRGIDVTVHKNYIDKVGFTHAEIKPLTDSGRRTMLRQIIEWGLNPNTVRPITYDAYGNVHYFGF